ncbi:molybdenum cofactor guanylyltransferase [Granulicella sp. dw_53]|uniref:molybdenum cofactor guanylyltransferase n=1 Tax=Granulicella sp. dw_53 TaxID=2719792 RepID=UPI001BD1F6AE|nr:molybdenum cofactor guanylyltransferase [Granulicella sp. dw_53]
MVWRMPSDVGGYVLAGGKSSRMGQDKALLPLQGKPLVLHAVVKLRRVCMDVHILSSKAELDAYAPLVRDLHPGSGPLGGIEAALMHSQHDWNLFMPVDMPFLPSSFLDRWVRMAVVRERRGQRISMFTVFGVPQPTLCLLHKDVLPFVSAALKEGRLKLYSVLEEAGRELALRQRVLLGIAFANMPWDENARVGEAIEGDVKGEAWWMLTEAQRAAQALWFSNVNTPEEFAEAERFAGALDT